MQQRLVAFLIANPYALLDFSSFINGVKQQASETDAAKLGRRETDIELVGARLRAGGDRNREARDSDAAGGSGARRCQGRGRR